jgi:hypothetical protein
LADKPKTVLPTEGEKLLIVGQNGSGKTAFAAWVLERIATAPTLIYDTKEETKFTALPKSRVAGDWDGVWEAMDDGESDFVIFRPPLEDLNDPERLDAYLLDHYHSFPQVPAYIDEAYSFHKNSREGPGLTALFTRGRSRGITTIISSQRPARISRFCITEAQRVAAFRLMDRKDRQRLADVIPNFDRMEAPKPFHFHYFQAGDDYPILYPPVPLTQGMDTGFSMSDNPGPAVSARDRFEWL